MTTARDLMTVDPVSIRETDTLVVAARTMRDSALFWRSRSAPRGSGSPA